MTLPLALKNSSVALRRPKPSRRWCEVDGLQLQGEPSDDLLLNVVGMGPWPNHRHFGAMHKIELSDINFFFG